MAAEGSKREIMSLGGCRSEGKIMIFGRSCSRCRRCKRKVMITGSSQMSNAMFLERSVLFGKICVHLLELGFDIPIFKHFLNIVRVLGGLNLGTG